MKSSIYTIYFSNHMWLKSQNKCGSMDFRSSQVQQKIGLFWRTYLRTKSLYKTLIISSSKIFWLFHLNWGHLNGLFLFDVLWRTPSPFARRYCDTLQLSWSCERFKEDCGYPKEIQISMIISWVWCNLHRIYSRTNLLLPICCSKTPQNFFDSYYKFDIWFKVSNYLYQVQIGTWSRVSNRSERNFSLCSQVIWGSPDVKHHVWSGDFVYKALGVIVITGPEVQGNKD